MIRPGIVLALLSFASIAQAQQAQAALQAQQAQQAQQTAAMQQAEHAHRLAEQEQLPLRLAIDPTRLVTVGLWPGPDVPCKLPKRDKPYVCHRLLVGPAVIYSQIYSELIVARGDAALARGERSWWVRGAPPVPLGLAAGEVLYQVGDDGRPGEGDMIATIYH